MQNVRQIERSEISEKKTLKEGRFHYRIEEYLCNRWPFVSFALSIVTPRRVQRRSRRSQRGFLPDIANFRQKSQHRFAITGVRADCRIKLKGPARECHFVGVLSEFR